MIRAAISVVVLLTVLAASEGTGLAGAPGGAGREAPGNTLTTAIVVSPFFGQLVEELLGSSATLRDQYDRIASAPRVRVWVEPMYGRPAERAARATISRSVSGVLLARVEIATPLRAVEYAELLSHELEHVLEQIEGVDLSAAARERSDGVSRLADGSYETERARRSGRAAALEVERSAQPSAGR
jgi:hypothetical protein